MSPRLSYPRHLRALLVLALPLIGSHVAQILLQVTNTVMLGWYGVDELAAAVLGVSTFLLLFLMGAGFAQAAMPLAAAALGRGDEDQVRRDIRMGMWLSVAYGLAILPIFWFAEPLLILLGQRPETAALAQDFMRITGLGMIPALLIMTLKSFYAALQRVQVVLWVTVASVGLNIVLNWFLIFGNGGAPELGLRGAAISSLMIQLFGLILLGGWAIRHPVFARFELFHRFWRVDGAALHQVWALGWPIGLTALMESGMFHATALMMGWIGTMELAAHGIAMEITALTFMTHLGLSNAATVRAGRAEGAGDAQGLRDGARVALATSQCFALAIITTFILMPAPIIQLFLDPANPRAADIVLYGTGLLFMAALFQVADAAQVVTLGLLRGIQDTRVPMIIAVLCYWCVGIPASYLLAFHAGMGGPGLWLGMVIGLTLTAIGLSLRFWSRAPRPQSVLA